MRRVMMLFALALSAPGLCFAQVSGNVGYSQYGQGSQAARGAERTKRAEGGAPSQTSMYVEASVLMNVPADQHVAIFAVMQECAAVPECNRKMDEAVGEFSAALRRLGVAAGDIFVDFTAQNKIYGFELAETVAREKLVGFELKKNVSVRYKEPLLLDKMVTAAAGAGIYDLVKVNYIVSDAGAVQQRLYEEAARIIKQKVARHEQLLNIRLRQPAQVIAERPSVYYPTGLYDSYTAAESESLYQPNIDRQKYAVQGARKSRTFFFNPLDADGFDHVINPVVLEPVVQFTLYVRMKYEMEQQLAK
jgi:uncharacterized protein YggE